MSADEKAGWKQRATEQNNRVQFLFPLVSSFTHFMHIVDVGITVQSYQNVVGCQSAIRQLMCSHKGYLHVSDSPFEPYLVNHQHVHFSVQLVAEPQLHIARAVATMCCLGHSLFHCIHSFMDPSISKLFKRCLG